MAAAVKRAQQGGGGGGGGGARSPRTEAGRLLLGKTLRHGEHVRARAAPRRAWG
jgi:hypothetical protein